MTPRPLSDRKLVAVVGKGRNCSQVTHELAHQVGQLLGRHAGDLVLVTGGLGGVMKSAGEAFRESGGVVLGILPGASSRTSAPSRSVDVAIDTGLTAQVRNVVLASCVDAVIALPGSHGTIQEMVVALDLQKPVVAVGQHAISVPGVNYLPSVEALDGELASWVTPR